MNWQFTIHCSAILPSTGSQHFFTVQRVSRPVVQYSQMPHPSKEQATLTRSPTLGFHLGNLFNDTGTFIAQGPSWDLTESPPMEVGVANHSIQLLQSASPVSSGRSTFFFNSNTSAFWIYNNSFHSYHHDIDREQGQQDWIDFCQQSRWASSLVFICEVYHKESLSRFFWNKSRTID